MKSLATAQKPAASDNTIRTWVESLGDGVIPKKYRKDVMKSLERASIEEVPYFSYGIMALILFVLAIGIDIFLMTTKIFANANIIIMILASIVMIPIIFIVLLLIATLLYKLYLEAKIYHKVRKMEEAFPEFLSEFALNLKSGQNLDEALENSTEKEFGYLTQEIQRVCKKIRLGMGVETAIKEFTDSFDSDVINETFDLIVTSWKKGTSTSQLVDRVYENLKVIRYLKEKVVASVTSYRIFLSVVTIIIAPAMFALSYYLIDLVRSITGKITDVSTSVVLPIPINAVRVNDAHFLLFSTLALLLISICTAMIISIIKTGSVKDGYKQVIFFAGGSVIAHQGFLFLFKYFFSIFKVS